METVKISTITLSTRLPDCQLNLTNIGKYLDIDDEIIGIKYNYADLSIMKGNYWTTVYKKAKVKDIEKINKRLFYNQVTIILKYNHHYVNIKLFGNGSLHLTGCKSISDGTAVTKRIYEKLMTLSNKTLPILLTKDANNIFIDKDKLVYSYTNHQVIGYYKSFEQKYVINNKEYTIDLKTKMFLSDKIETKRRRFIHNLDGDYIGYSKIELLKNRHKFYKKNTNIHYDIANGLIYHNNDNIIGKIIYDIDQAQITNVKDSPDILEIEYNCNPFITIKKVDLFDTNLDSVFDTNVNCMNIYFNLDYKINRQRLYEKIIEYNYICKYKPESYSGIKMSYKIPLTDASTSKGICTCSNKCTCINITFLIFQSGNIIATGFKSQEQINLAVEDFLILCNGFKKNIQKRLFSTSL